MERFSLPLQEGSYLFSVEDETIKLGKIVDVDNELEYSDFEVGDPQ